MGDGTFYDFTIGSSPKAAGIDSSQFYEDQYSYYFSPSAKQTTWAETRDGKNTVLVAAAAGANSKTVASLSEYNPEGWFGENYILLSKKGSELFIMGVGGGEPFKVTDYQSTYNFY